MAKHTWKVPQWRAGLWLKWLLVRIVFVTLTILLALQILLITCDGALNFEMWPYGLYCIDASGIWTCDDSGNQIGVSIPTASVLLLTGCWGGFAYALFWRRTACMRHPWPVRRLVALLMISAAVAVLLGGGLMLPWRDSIDDEVNFEARRVSFGVCATYTVNYNLSTKTFDIAPGYAWFDLYLGDRLAEYKRWHTSLATTWRVGALGVALERRDMRADARMFGRTSAHGYRLSFPFWLLAALLLIYPAALVIRPPKRRLDDMHCNACGYNLTGNVSGRCPECGAAMATGAASRHG